MFFHTIYKENKRRWIFDDEPYHEVPRMSNTRNKRIFTMFFNSKGVIHIQFQEEGFSVKSIDYIEALQNVKKNLIEFGIKNPILHQDNSPVHISYESQVYYQLDD